MWNARFICFVILQRVIRVAFSSTTIIGYSMKVCVIDTSLRLPVAILIDKHRGIQIEQ